MTRVNEGRIAAIDILRGIAITGMVLCANIGFQSDLPAWMFHGQTPPPTYEFRPDVAGITWVDLVFPFFLFAMGAAFPLSMKKKLESGQSKFSIAANLLKRWFILTIFALVIGNTESIYASTRPLWQICLFIIGTWAALFISLVRIPDKGKSGNIINLCGVALLCLLAFLHCFWFEVPLDKYRSDIIIMILANTALWGGLIWVATRNSLQLRCLITGFILMLKALSSYVPETLAFVPSFSKLGWLFSWEWLQYLIIVLPGSIIGDLLLCHSRSKTRTEISDMNVIAGIVALAAVILQLWGLYSRNVLADFIITVILAGTFIFTSARNRQTCSTIGIIGFGLLIAGIIFDPIDGGITKDHCNISYLLTTGGMAALTVSFLLTIELRFGVKGRFLSGIGQNPMLAYTFTTFIIRPLLHLTGHYNEIFSIAAGSPFLGMVQGIVITAIMMFTTYGFTKAKLFWRS